jgi:hypothetical protein
LKLTDPRQRRLIDTSDICQSVLAIFFVRAAAGQWIDGIGRAVLVDGLVQPALGVKGGAKAVVRLGDAGIDLDGLSVFRDCLAHLALLEPGRSDALTRLILTTKALETYSCPGLSSCAM